MNIEEIMRTKEILDAQLRVALSTMERKDIIKELKKEIDANQMACPHFSDKYNFTMIDGKCPYCGKNLE